MASGAKRTRFFTGHQLAKEMALLWQIWPVKSDRMMDNITCNHLSNSQADAHATYDKLLWTLDRGNTFGGR
jgi:hypothetical protein